MAEAASTIDQSGKLAINSLLSTKLFIPQARHLHAVLPRPRLVERLKAGLLRKLTLISAPAGFGKTTLLAEWIPQNEQCVCWLSLDETDNDLTRFLSYFSQALGYFHQALSLAAEIEAKLEQFQGHLALAQAYKAQGNFQMALAHYEQFHAIKETVFNTQADNRLKSLQKIMTGRR